MESGAPQQVGSLMDIVGAIERVIGVPSDTSDSEPEVEAAAPPSEAPQQTTPAKPVRPRVAPGAPNPPRHGAHFFLISLFKLKSISRSLVLRVVRIPMSLQQFLAGPGGLSAAEATTAEADIRTMLGPQAQAPAQAEPYQRRLLTVNGAPRLVKGTATTFNRLATIKRRQAVHSAIGNQMAGLSRLFLDLGRIDDEMYNQSALMLPLSTQPQPQPQAPVPAPIQGTLLVNQRP